MRSLNNEILRQLEEEYGADGVELSAHALCAEDHLPYQGRQFSDEEFEQLQGSLARPFGQWNCRHTMFPIILGVSKPVHSPEELAAYARNSRESIEIGGREKTRYEWTQEQRKIETAVRQQRDTANLAKACGDDTLRREAQANINALQDRYAQINKASGLAEQPQRMAVAGFRPVKTAEQLKKPMQSGIIASKIGTNGEVVNPMNVERYNIMKAGMAKRGIIVMEAKDDDLRYLKYGIGAEATYSHGYIMHIGKIPSASGMFEEIIHSTQAIKYGELPSTDVVELSAREVAANRMLVKHGKAYGFDKTDFDDTKANLARWENLYRKATGCSYDEGNHNREI